MATGDLQGWYSDPFAQHEKRYFSAGSPTKLVRDGDVDSFAEPPAESWIPTQDMLMAGAPGVDSGSDSSPGSTMQLGGIVFGSASGHVHSKRSPAKVGRSRGWRNALLMVLGASVAFALVVFFQRSSSPAPTSSVRTVAFVTQAAHQTLAQRSAYMTLSGTIQAGSHTATITGSGEADFSANAATLNLSMQTQGHSLTEKEIVVGGNLYISEAIDGKSMAQFTGGAEWIRMPVRQTGTVNVTGGDPRVSLSMLEQAGNTIRAVGTRTIDGVTCSGYAVTMSTKSMIAALRKEAKASGLPATVANSEMQVVQTMSPPTVTVWLDGHEFIREMSLNMQMNELGTSVSGTMAIELSHFGAPVHITAPAPSDTILYSSLLRDTFNKGPTF